MTVTASVAFRNIQRDGPRSVACPVCSRPLALGVLHRVRYVAQQDEDSGGPAQLAPAQFPINGRAFPIRRGLCGPRGEDHPLSGCCPCRKSSRPFGDAGQPPRTVQMEYMKLVAKLGSELELLVWAKERDLASVAGEELARVILQARRGHIRAKAPDMTGSTAGCLWPGMTLSRDCPDQTDSPTM